MKHSSVKSMPLALHADVLARKMGTRHLGDVVKVSLLGDVGGPQLVDAEFEGSGAAD